MRFLLIIPALFSMALASPSAAQEADRRECFVVGNDNWDDQKLEDRRLAACTRYIAKVKGKPKSEGYASRGYWYTKKKRLDEALADFNRALEIDPANVELYDYKGDVLFQKGELQAAIDNYNQSIRIDPTYAAAYYSRGQVYEKQGHLEQARESYRAALVPPENRKLAIQKRIQVWAQGEARDRLKKLGEAAK